MGGLFSKKKPVSRVTIQDKAVLQLKNQRDKLMTYRKRIEVQMENERLLAKTLLSQNEREKAKLLLRKKKAQEQMVIKTEKHLANLETMIDDIQMAQMEQKVTEGLKQGNEALKALNQLMSVDEIERILDETHEAAEKQQEISSLLSGNLTTEDEIDVLAELEDLVKESLPDVPETEEIPYLPEVPDEEPLAEPTPRDRGDGLAAKKIKMLAS